MAADTPVVEAVGMRAAEDFPGAVDITQRLRRIIPRLLQGLPLYRAR
jgi:hypothetical protein